MKARVKATPAKAKKPQQHVPRPRNRFRQTETKRLMKAALAAGLSIQRVEVDGASGRVSIIPGAPVDTATESNSWDSVLTK